MIDAAEIARALGGKPNGHDWICYCPAHDDRNASLSVSEENGKILVHCHANCSQQNVIAALKQRRLWGLISKPEAREREPRPHKTARYVYHDQNGERRYRVIRMSNKQFPQERYEAGRYIRGMDGVERLPYRLPELLDTPLEEVVFLAEGEKDTRSLHKLGLAASCNSGGAGKWLPEISKWFKGRDVVILPDNDDPGRKHAQDVATKLHGIAQRIRILELPGLEPKGDVSDWVEAGGTRKELLKLAAKAPDWQESPAGKSLPQIDLGAPYDAARLLIKELFTSQSCATIYRHRGSFYTWNGIAYREVSDAEMRARVYAFLDQCETSKSEPIRPNTRSVNDVTDALRAAALLPDSVAPPAWLSANDTPADEILACTNGLLHLPSLELSSHTPEFFTLNALDYDYAPDAKAPTRWLGFLRQLWPKDDESIETLQEVFGYCLTADTSQQKAFLLVGPKRSGKGTIGRVLTRLAGVENVVAPTLAGLGTNFGLAPLVGKRVAIISDARLSGRADQHVIAERVLSITGEDAITIDRKYREAWTGRIGSRFLVLTNELPRLADASGALTSRFIVLALKVSFFDREDPGLTNKLLVELPGILNWAIAGWKRLRKRGYFVQPNSALELVDELEALGSPVAAFVRELCEIGRGKQASPDELYKYWRIWCESQGREKPGTIQNFGRELRAAVPGIKAMRRREGDDRERFYQGIALRKS